MIQVTVGNNVRRNPAKLFEKTTTLRAILEDAELDYTRGSMTLDGATLLAGDLDKTLADFGIAEKCFLLNVVKADNA